MCLFNLCRMTCDIVKAYCWAPIPKEAQKALRYPRGLKRGFTFHWTNGHDFTQRIVANLGGQSQIYQEVVYERAPIFALKCSTIEAYYTARLVAFSWTRQQLIALSQISDALTACSDSLLPHTL
jgi:hypothetical protein